MYHEVGAPPAPDDPWPPPMVSVANFAWQMRHLRRAYAVVTVAEVQDRIATRRPPAAIPAALTFDDDLWSHAETAGPALARAGLPATAFLTGGLGAGGFWWQRLRHALRRGIPADEILGPGAPARGADVAQAIWELDPRDLAAVDARLRELVPELAREEAPLTPDAVGRLRINGVAVGFHSATHRPLTRLSDDALAFEMQEGRAALEAAAGQRLEAIAYPFGDADARVAAAASAAGFGMGFTTREAPLRPGDDPMLLPRIEVHDESPGRFALRLARAALRS